MPAGVELQDRHVLRLRARQFRRPGAEGYGEPLFLAAAQQAKLDFRTRRLAAHRCDKARRVLDFHAIQQEQDVIGQQPRLLRRAAGHGLDDLRAMRAFPAERVRLLLRHVLQLGAEEALGLLLRPRRTAPAQTKQKDGKCPHRNPPKQLSAAPYHSAAEDGRCIRPIGHS